MAGDEEEDDYLNMTFEEPKPAKETSIQRTARLKKESAARGRILSKKEREEQARQARETALATEIDSSSKGAQMMAKMGFKGGALGKTEGARTRPIEVVLKDDRGGIGMESDKKRKFREAAEALEGKEKKVKLTAEEYRERNRQEAEDKRLQAQWRAAMHVLEGFDTDGETGKEEGQDGEEEGQGKKTDTKHPPLRSVNVLWRPLLKHRLEKERERRMRFDLEQSLSRSRQYDDPELEKDDYLAFGTEVVEDLDEEDKELDEYEELSLGERLEKILMHLREKYHYCFWCKYRYPDETMDGCPGLSEDEHG